MKLVDEPSNGNNIVRINLNMRTNDEQDAHNARADPEYTRTITVDNCSDQEDVSSAELDQNEFSRRKNDPHPCNLGQKMGPDSNIEHYTPSGTTKQAQILD